MNFFLQIGHLSLHFVNDALKIAAISTPAT
jgi:hypothetical protein